VRIHHSEWYSLGSRFLESRAKTLKFLRARSFPWQPLARFLLVHSTAEERLLKSTLAAALILLATLAHASALPGFRVEMLGSTAGFADSIAIDSHGTIYYTTTNGNLFRFASGQSTLVAHVTTVAVGDSGLLGMALIDDGTAVVHYTTPGQGYDVVSKIDLSDGSETVLQRFVADITFPGRDAPPEHHGGNPSVAGDGTIFVGIGDYGGGLIASLPEWNGGKVFRIFPDGHAEQFARGFRNPFDMAWDPLHQRLVLTDNGDAVNDEINIVTAGGYYGWPFTAGNAPPVPGGTAPLYVFPQIVAPTGMVRLNGKNGVLTSGYLIGAFVTKAIYYVPDIDADPFPDPIALIQKETGFVIDVAQAPSGEIYFVTGNALYHLITPARGDCNGDGKVDADDLAALAQALLEGPHATIATPGAAQTGSWGCDVNGDGVVDTRDMTALVRMLSSRSRSIRR
jgi:glucose/arabinose dehydrogenase